MVTPKTPKSAKIICCEKCDFVCSKKSEWNRHINTIKHNMVNYDNAQITENAPKIFGCKCGKQYLHASGLSRHQKKCIVVCTQNNINNSDESNILLPPSDPINTCLIIELLKQNQEFKSLIADQNKQLMEQHKYFIENQDKQILEQNNQNKQMMDQNKQMMELVSKGIGNTINSNNTVIKTKFNLNIFLNEQCKDAMNIMDFVNSLQLKLSDLERVGEFGYVKGISHIILNKLKALDICKRPIHCSDLKRETMYVKDENTWEKENGKNEKITKMIKHVAHKNQLQINEWRQENPAHKNPESIKCDKFLAIVNQSMGGSTEDDDINNYNKIVKNIAKEVIIDKDQE
jgi:hypothetical protein